MSLKNAFKLVRANRPISQPNKEFFKELQKYEQFIHYGNDWDEGKIKEHFKRKFDPTLKF